MQCEVKVELGEIERRFPFWEVTNKRVCFIVCGWQWALLMR
jgi:hypothetical protein